MSSIRWCPNQQSQRPRTALRIAIMVMVRAREYGVRARQSDSCSHCRVFTCHTGRRVAAAVGVAVEYAERVSHGGRGSAAAAAAHCRFATACLLHDLICEGDLHQLEQDWGGGLSKRRKWRFNVPRSCAPCSRAHHPTDCSRHIDPSSRPKRPPLPASSFCQDWVPSQFAQASLLKSTVLPFRCPSLTVSSPQTCPCSHHARRAAKAAGGRVQARRPGSSHRGVVRLVGPAGAAWAQQRRGPALHGLDFSSTPTRSRPVPDRLQSHL